MAVRKKFIEVNVPAVESSVKVLGTPEELDNKTIKLDLSRKIRGKGIEVTFTIKNTEEGPTAFPKKIELMKSYIQRMMRKRVSYVEDSFQTPCKDIRAIVKPFLITRKKVSRAVRKNLRNTAREFLEKHLAEKNYVDVCNEILDGELQKVMLPRLKKVYPLSFTDIRVLETKELGKAELKQSKPQKEASEEIEEKTEEKQEKEKSEEGKKEAEETKPKKEKKKTEKEINSEKEEKPKKISVKKTEKKKPAKKTTAKKSSSKKKK